MQEKFLEIFRSPDRWFLLSAFLALIILSSGGFILTTRAEGEDVIVPGTSCPATLPEHSVFFPVQSYVAIGYGYESTQSGACTVAIDDLQMQLNPGDIAVNQLQGLCGMREGCLQEDTAQNIYLGVESIPNYTSCACDQQTIGPESCGVSRWRCQISGLSNALCAGQTSTGTTISTTTGTECTSDTNCTKTLAPYCISGYCGQCRGSSDCPAYAYCSDLHRCLNYPDLVTCTDDGDCETGQTCVANLDGDDGYCANTEYICTSSSDCSDGFDCVDSACVPQ